MKKVSLLILVTFLLSGLFFSCNKSESKAVSSTEIDSVLTRLELIDSIQNSGTYSHLEAWKVGSITDYSLRDLPSLASKYSVDLYANKLSFKEDTLLYITFEYNENSEYSSKYETKSIDVKELKALYSSIDDIKKNFDKKTDHFELYEYKSKSGAILRLKHFADSSNKVLTFCSIGLKDTKDLDELKQLLVKAEKKITEISKPSKK